MQLTTYLRSRVLPYYLLGSLRIKQLSNLECLLWCLRGGKIWIFFLRIPGFVLLDSHRFWSAWTSYARDLDLDFSSLDSFACKLERSRVGKQSRMHPSRIIVSPTTFARFKPKE